MLTPGLRGESHLIVEYQSTAAALGLEGADVLGTPFMISLMEMASHNAIAAHLDPGQITLGTLVNVTHLAATPLGMRVTATSRLVEFDGRRLVFEVEARDEVDKIGEGRHERTLVDFQRFMQRVNAKKSV